MIKYLNISINKNINQFQDALVIKTNIFMKTFNSKRMKYLIGIVFMLFCSHQLFSQLPAFPGAVGFGANAVGGRSGTIIYVTNLNDSGAGSLREACQASGPRTVIFRVGGTIELTSSIKITNPFITIAGQTAPGDGICLKIDQTNPYGDALIKVRTDDVIIRFIRLRRGPGIQDELSGDCITFSNFYGPVKNCIIDHCSASWSTDELINGWYDNSYITVQNCIASEALDNSTHGKGIHSKGPFFGDRSNNITLYQNYMCHNKDRNGYFVSGVSGHNAIVEHVNNVTYNWVYFGNNYGSFFGGVVHANVIGNYMVAGPDTRTSRYEIGVEDYESPKYSTQIFVANNLGPHRKFLSLDEWDIVGDRTNFTYPAQIEYQAEMLFDTPLADTTLMPQTAYDYVITSAGAFARLDENGDWVYNRDSTDTRVINDMITYSPRMMGSNGTYGIIDHPDDVGGWNTYSSGIPYPDSDQDGMANAWEIAYGLNPNDPLDANGTDLSIDGYTNIEMFLNLTDTSSFKQYLLTLGVVGSGSVSHEDKSYNEGTQIIVEATPDTGWTFTGWSGDFSGSINPKSIIMNDNKSIIANFAPTYTLTTNVVGSGMISASPSGKTHIEGTVVTLTATSASNYTFLSWSGDLSGATSPMDITIDANKSVTATFIQNTGVSGEYQESDLINNYPNPFSFETIFEYSVFSHNKVQLLIYNSLGQLVTVVVNKNQSANTYKVVWNGTDSSGNKLNNGIYTYQFSVGNKVITRNIILMK